MPGTSLRRLRPNRSPEAVLEWASRFGKEGSERARRYTESLEAFLGRSVGQEGWGRYVGGLSPHTRRAYAHALGEFFEWAAQRKGRVVEPSEVTATDATEFVQWLANRPYGLEEARLRATGDQERVQIYETVKRLGEARQPEIAAALPRSLVQTHPDPREDVRDEIDEQWLSHALGRMVLRDYLERNPSLQELRRWPSVLVQDDDGTERWVEQRPQSVPIEVTQPWPRAGIDQEEIEVQLGDETRTEKLWNVFRYRLRRPAGVSPRTATARVSALSSYWELLLKGDGEHEPLVKGNPWYAVRRRTLRGSAKRARRAAAEQRIEGTVLVRLLQAAEQASTLVELRNKAMVYLLLFSAVRIEELIRLRRGIPGVSEQSRWPGWFDGNEPPSIVVLRKGGETQRIPYPPIALRALSEFQGALERTSTRSMRSDSAMAVRYRDLATMQDAPLLPPLTMWGANSGEASPELTPNGLPNYTKSMTPSGATAALKRIGRRAGLTPTELRQVHPHALRHFAITAMVKEGKDLREVQAMAGHSSVTTTEGYIEAPTSRVALSGQAEIMRYLERIGVTEPAARPAKESRTRKVIETRGESRTETEPPEPTTTAEQSPVLTEGRPEEKAPSWAAEERLPAHELPVVPMNQEPEIKAVETGAGQAVEMGDSVIGIDGKDPITDLATAYAAQLIGNKSAGQPDAVYEAMEDAVTAHASLLSARSSGSASAVAEAERDLAAAQSRREPIAFTSAYGRKKGDDAKTIEYRETKGKEQKELVQRNKWLREHYDPWPVSYGIGRRSLLPWFQRGSPTPDGYLQVGDEEFPPLPVLPPEYVKPETVGGKRMMDFVQNRYEAWIQGSDESPPSPTRAFGLVRWFAFFAYTTSRLQRYMDDFRAHYRFHPWSDVCEVGRDLRSHKLEWVQDWLDANSHTYLTSMHALRRMPRGKTLQHDHEFWEAFARVAFEGMTLTSSIPEWFLEDDPIRALERPEYEEFERWIANVTGQRLTRERQRDRSTARDFEREEAKDRQGQVRGLLEDVYYPTIDEITETRKSGIGPETIPGLETTLRSIEQSLVALGALDPRNQEFVDIPDRGKRIQAILGHMKVDDEAAPADENILAGSELFDKRWFKIDAAERTIKHDPEFAAWFQEQFGVDSELVIRRSARAMWEHVKERRWQEKEQLTSSQYNYLYSIMLNYLAWVVPAPEAMERAMAESGQAGLTGPQARRQWLERHIATVRSMLYEEAMPEAENEPVTEQEQVDWLVEHQGIDRASAEAMLRSRAIIETFGAEQARGVELQQAGMGEALLRSGAGRAFAPFAAAEERRRFEEQEAAALAQDQPLKPNCCRCSRMQVERRQVVVRRMPGERPATLFQVGHGLQPNAGPRSYYSLGVWRQQQQQLAPLEQTLPSPFAMIHAMSVG